MDLTSRINDALAPWRLRSDEPPPFTQGELVVMALVLHDRPMTRRQLFLWMYNTFAYYNTRDTRVLWKELNRQGCSPRPQMQYSTLPDLPYAPDFHDSLLNYNLPVRGPMKIEIRTALFGPSTATWAWSVNLAKASLFLRSRLWLKEESRGHFPFLDLPAEIRNTIYEMVFTCPPSGVQIGGRCGEGDRTGPAGSMVYAKIRDFNVSFTSDVQQVNEDFLRHGAPKFTWRQDDLLEVGKLSTVLALTRVSRQIRREARSFFFEMNTFCFSDMAHLRYVLERLATKDRNHVRRIAVAHRYNGSAYVRDAFSIMVIMPSLRWLHISILQSEWDSIYRSAVGRDLGFQEAPPLPNEVEIVLGGDYPADTMESIQTDPLLLWRRHNEKMDRLIAEAEPRLHRLHPRPSFRDRLRRFQEQWSVLNNSLFTFGRRIRQD